MSPTEWFDQFPLAPGWPEGGQWCARHWAPCPILGANGMGATVQLMQIFVSELAPADQPPAAMQAALDKAGRLCCALGDQRMYDLWGKWPPSGGRESVS